MTLRKRAIALLLFLLSLAWALPVRGEGMDWEALMEKYRYEEYEELYFNILEQCGEPGTPGFAAQPQAVRNLFVVMIFDMEIQNGGVAQFYHEDTRFYTNIAIPLNKKTESKDHVL